ncbi:glycosyltransferase family 4 protein [Solitalea sp. MAHUQ-68]|uniref:Glycosyltransferase family 4 protein n=1 Tax=Solitalea agri TaxID=2953739 RepID=A0A9X2F2X6_9SPHI|nr:glycosyltransferase family 4 protein [Solitalea agri]MCO4293652.1 glycosyltransferase family 4 protein [Solitalea agri]
MITLEKRKVCHLTSVHRRYDVRIYYKECQSLANAGYDVNLIVADGNGYEEKDKVKIHDVGKYKNRLERVTSIGYRIYSKALKLNSDLYHIHDPELLIVGWLLARKGKRVIYDVHEDLPRQVLAKAYIPSVMKRPLSFLVEGYEGILSKKMTGIVTVTPLIKERYHKLNKNVIEVRNYPIMTEGIKHNDWNKKKQVLCYIGGISEVRGIKQMVQAMKFTNGLRLNLGGVFESDSLRNEVIAYEGWSKVNELSFLDRINVVKVLDESKIGLVTLQPTINYIDSLPVKMFEYMLAGIPVIASKFPLWQSIIDEHNCGICVDPTNPEEIAAAINYLMKNDNEAREMGERGRRAVLEHYTWLNEEQKMIESYKRWVAS